jgi:hypothetical protein
MRNLFFAAFICLAVLGLAVAQTAENATQEPSLIKEFTRSAKTEGLVLSFVLLTDKTVDALFQPPGKFAIRARANQATTFYVQGIPEKDINFDSTFVIVQDGQSLNATTMNIKNFTSGNVAKGQMINGLIQLDRKLELTHPFSIKGNSGTVEFKLSDAALGAVK